MEEQIKTKLSVTKEDFNKMVDRMKDQTNLISAIYSDPSFNIEESNYDLQFHFRVLLECVYMLQSMLKVDKTWLD